MGFGGKGGGGSAPSTPDPQATAQAQAAANKEAVRESAKVNQINQVTPYGSLTYTGDIGSPDRTATVALSPEQQQMLELQNQAGLQYGQIGNQQLGAVSDRLSQPLDYSALGAAPQANEATRQNVADSLYARLNPQLDRARQQREAQLATQGIPLGSQAYSSAQDDLARAENDARLATEAQALNQMSQLYGLEQNARNQQINETIQQRQQPLNELAALYSGSQVQSPNFINTPTQQVAPPDISGYTYGSANLANQQYQANMANAAQNRQGLYSLLGTGLLAGGLAFGR